MTGRTLPRSDDALDGRKGTRVMSVKTLISCTFQDVDAVLFLPKLESGRLNVFHDCLLSLSHV